MRSAHRLTTSSLVLALSFALAGFVVPSAVAATDSAGSGRLHLTGDAAAAFVVPRDVTIASSWSDSTHDLVYTRYQQFARPFGVHVDGAQLTVVKRDGRQVLVIGSYYAALRVFALPSISALRASAIAAAGIDIAHDQRSELRFDPAAGRLFYRVESGAAGVALVHEVDATTGKVLDSWDALADAAYDGVGVKGDTKSLASGAIAGIGNLTSQPGGAGNPWKMISADGRIATYTANGGNNYINQPLVSDANNGNDNVWNATNQRAAVDAQYYAALTAAFYEDRLNFDVFAACGQADGVFEQGLRSVVHYDPTPSNGVGYANAQWDPFAHYTIYGDGDSQTRAMSGAQDVVTHELTHAVTQCRAELDYFAQSGALNEAFSDIMAISAEWDLEEPTNSNCRLALGQTECADWLLGEDAVIDPAMLAFRDFADPASQGQPSHFDDRLYPSCNSPSPYNDNCGVHYNSGIANHAFYLLVNGGRNARCSGPSDPQDDCDVVVPGIDLPHAEEIFFAGFLSVLSRF
ncbi:MAG: M4 family metallopeptidase [Chloroflexota bacterium]